MYCRLAQTFGKQVRQVISRRDVVQDDSSLQNMGGGDVMQSGASLSSKVSRMMGTYINGFPQVGLGLVSSY